MLTAFQLYRPSGDTESRGSLTQMRRPTLNTDQRTIYDSVTPTNESDYHAANWMGFEWSPWRSLNPADGGFSEISTNPGIYRI